jgi:hypothetical protein
MVQIGPVPGRPVDLPVPLAKLAREALARGQFAGGRPEAKLAELEYLATEERVSAVAARCRACGLVQGPRRESCWRCGAARPEPITVALALTISDLLMSSGLAHSPGKAALLLRHRAVQIDGAVVAQEAVPLRDGSIIATVEGLQTRIVSAPPAESGAAAP